MDLLGAKDIIAKSLGSSNNLNVAQATLLALQKLRTKPEEAVAEKVVETKSEVKEVKEKVSPAEVAA
jgi:ribosomal protein S5